MVAFANTYGGTVYFGLNEAGVPLGVDDFDEIERSIFSFARNGVNPDMSRLIRVKPIHLPDGRSRSDTAWRRSAVRFQEQRLDQWRRLYSHWRIFIASQALRHHEHGKGSDAVGSAHFEASRPHIQ